MAIRVTLIVLCLLAAACQPFRVGVTHGQQTANFPPANTPEVRELLTRIPLQNQHIMGFGALNPNPSPGVYDWDSLDRRMAFIMSTGAEPVITLCCAPDWMKGGTPGETDWSQIEVEPDPEHFEDYAFLAGLVAARYPYVKYFQVWNELKGFWKLTANTWNMESFVEFYNAVHGAVKAVRPDALIGGPYVPVVVRAEDSSHPSSITGEWGTVDQRSLDVIEYWLDNAEGDFITMDGWLGTTDRGLITTAAESAKMFSEVTKWVRTRTDLPIWWSEVHAAIVSPNWNEFEQAYVTDVTLEALESAGASVALLWDPQADGPCRGCLWSAYGDLSVTGDSL